MMVEPKVRELTVVFLNVAEHDWLVYLEQLPDINCQGTTPKEALSRAMQKLQAFDQRQNPALPPPGNRFSYRVSSLHAAY